MKTIYAKVFFIALFALALFSFSAILQENQALATYDGCTYGECGDCHNDQDENNCEENFECWENSDCGENRYAGSPFCLGNDVYQSYITYTCNNPGTANSSCSSNVASQKKTDCASNQICKNASCADVQDNLTVSCYANPNTVNTNQSVTFISNVWGGSGNYSYSWSGACSGNSQSCSNSFSQQGARTATINVTSGSQSNSANCSVNVNQYQTATLTANKTVRNLTSGSSNWSSTVYANPSDVLMFMITLQSAGNQTLNNIFVKDIFPSNLIYKNQMIVAGASNYSGDIISGLNIGTMSGNQTVTITYQAQVGPVQNFSYGTTTLNNSAYVTSSSGQNPTSNATVIVTRSAVYGASFISTGLTNNFLADSFFLPLLAVVLGVWMWRSGAFFGIEKWLSNKRKTLRAYKSDKKLLARIATIKNTEKA